MRLAAPSFSRSRLQRGIALYVALIMLLLLTLLGLAAIQVTAMQERMVGNYRTFNLAFNRTEQALRDEEFKIQDAIARFGAFGVPSDPAIQCSVGNINGLGTLRGWANDVLPTGAAQVRVANITGCSGILTTVKDENSVDQPLQTFLVLASQSDRDTGPSSVVVLEATYTERPAAL